MRNVILIVILLIFTFSINVIFFYVSSNYRDLLSSFKTEKQLNIKNNDKIESVTNSGESVTEWQLAIVAPSNKNEEIFSQNNDKKIEIKWEVVLWKIYKEILKLFSSYDLKELEINTTLFDITTEYPDNYLEYYSKELTLYFFPTKKYSEVYDIFDTLRHELPFTINETNNFWEKSFYINLNEDINDNIVRVVISYEWIPFWLKMKKNEYNLVKEKLNTLN